MDVGAGVVVAAGKKALVGAIVARGDSRGGTTVVSEMVVGSDAGRSGEGAEDAGALAGSDVVRISVDVGRIVAFGKRAFVRSVAKISSATPTAATPIQLYRVMKGGAVGDG